jgi:uncharacterized protein YdeI (YjbR/CyaY-like superfamily)
VDIARETGIKARLRVKGKIDGTPFSGTLLPFGSGKHFIVVKKEIRDRIGKKEGDEVEVEMDVDSSPVRVAVPEDMSRALAKNKSAKAAFDGMAPSHRKAYVAWIEGAKKAETRAGRIEKAVEMIAKGRHL